MRTLHGGAGGTGVGGFRGECASSRLRSVGMCKPANHIYAGPWGRGDGQSFSRSSSRIEHREFTLDKGLVGTGMWGIITFNPGLGNTRQLHEGLMRVANGGDRWPGSGPPVRSHPRSLGRAGEEGRPPAAGLRGRRPHAAFLRVRGRLYLFAFPLSFVITAGTSSRENSLERSPEDPVTAGARHESPTIAGRSVPRLLGVELSQGLGPSLGV